MRSVRNVTHPEDLPELGSREAAVESCASLIAGMAGQPEAIMHYWLDLYYQVRLAYEIEADQRRRSEAHRFDAERFKKSMGILRRANSQGATTTEGDAQDAEEKAPAPEAQTEGKSAAAAAAGDENGAERSALPSEAPSELTGPRRARSSAAAFKMNTVERLRRMRQDGLTVGRIVELSRGTLTEVMVMDILDAKKMPIDVYRTLAAVLDEAETETT